MVLCFIYIISLSSSDKDICTCELKRWLSDLVHYSAINHCNLQMEKNRSNPWKFGGLSYKRPNTSSRTISVHPQSPIFSSQGRGIHYFDRSICTWYWLPNIAEFAKRYQIDASLKLIIKVPVLTEPHFITRYIYCCPKRNARKRNLPHSWKNPGLKVKWEMGVFWRQVFPQAWK